MKIKMYKKSKFILAVSLLLITLLVQGCTRKPLSKLEGNWDLDTNAMMGEIIKLKLDITPDVLNELRLKLEKEKPRIKIDGVKIEMEVRSASVLIEFKVIGHSAECIDILVAGKTEMRYCLEDNGAALHIRNINGSEKSITEIYKRSR